MAHPAPYGLPGMSLAFLGCRKRSAVNTLWLDGHKLSWAYPAPWGEQR